MLEHKFEPEVYERLEAAIQGRSELGEYYGSPEEVLEDLQECVFILGVIVESLRKMSQRGVMRGIDGGQRDDPR